MHPSIDPCFIHFFSLDALYPVDFLLHDGLWYCFMFPVFSPGTFSIFIKLILMILLSDHECVPPSGLFSCLLWAGTSLRSYTTLTVKAKLGKGKPRGWKPPSVLVTSWAPALPCTWQTASYYLSADFTAFLPLGISATAGSHSNVEDRTRPGLKTRFQPVPLPPWWRMLPRLFIPTSEQVPNHLLSL